jgi:hypothetical protein
VAGTRRSYDRPATMASLRTGERDVANMPNTV